MPQLQLEVPDEILLAEKTDPESLSKARSGAPILRKAASSQRSEQGGSPSTLQVHPPRVT